MNEHEIIYSLLEIIRANEISDDERMTEAFIRNLLYTYRADSIKSEIELSEELYQPYLLSFEPKDKNSGIFQSKNLPDIIYNMSRAGIMLNDLYGNEIAVVSKEEAIISRKSRFFRPLYIAYINGDKLILTADLERLATSSDINNNLVELLYSFNPDLEISCILTNPNNAIDYNWKKTTFPLSSQKIAAMKQKILRQEFGIMQEVKKDEIQNSRADNIIYQDESKLYK